jgi:hypothetical protein
MAKSPETRGLSGSCVVNANGVDRSVACAFTPLSAAALLVPGGAAVGLPAACPSRVQPTIIAATNQLARRIVVMLQKVAL